ncbi:MAG: tRNA1(Val) (adenine(37)-N6)-methyltransferase [Brevundimonas sp.]|jgi:tRNA1(Val) A37 N6-methylase TrmN6|uniref:tRNA1(Val) (adenine(37)-N6)-methyltransferase n=1 Tax=Brevundimonas sp. TaxID=1871086 RepID=UPI00391AAB40
MGGTITLTQPRHGYRAGMDAGLLAAACQRHGPLRIIEAGCGVGAALLQVAARNREAQLTGLERDEQAVALARANADDNAMGERVRIVRGDVAHGFRALGEPAFDLALCNPPYFDDETKLRAPAPERRGAWIADDGLGAWLGFLLKAVREGGEIVIIHRAERLADILAGLAPKAGSFMIRPVHPHDDAPAKRVIVRAVKTGRAPLTLLPALVMHTREGARHTPQAEAILRGERALEWR